MNFKDVATQLSKRLQGLKANEILKQPESIEAEFGFLKNNVSQILSTRGERVAFEYFEPWELHELFKIAQDKKDVRWLDAQYFIKDELNIPAGEQAFSYQRPEDMKVTTVIINGTKSTSDEFESTAGALLNATGKVNATVIHAAEDEFMKSIKGGWNEQVYSSEMREIIYMKAREIEIEKSNSKFNQEFGFLKEKTPEILRSHEGLIDNKYGDKFVDLLMVANTYGLEGKGGGPRGANPWQPLAVKFLANDLGLKDQELSFAYQHGNVLENGKGVFYAIKIQPADFKKADFDYELKGFDYAESAINFANGVTTVPKGSKKDNLNPNPTAKGYEDNSLSYEKARVTENPALKASSNILTNQNENNTSKRGRKI
ncbi:hypothetical protein WOSG25_110350 [Weissella oryzae SG25]|uniref:Uncharacterized protein n=1 Tax=Weissella oryzae (strain DSM 25784 / JCM 18191 / LMG 30913 / SG25) TaxID=1329250 RepID=A0A069CVY8_WEIOS|nr:hypothetical protein [Weissella oryzae]GAK31557.1 hypothetical protein WOSG25_110350 [Weissella oryzae SG25]